MSKLIVVVENTAQDSNLGSEHGLSLWLEHQGRNLLYDTGVGKNLLPNLKALGLDPALLDGVVLSHGHYDHVGGLAPLLRLRLEKGLGTPIWCHEAVFAPHLKQKQNEVVSIAPEGHEKAIYEGLGARFSFVENSLSLWPGVRLWAPIPRVTDFEGPAPSLVTMEGDKVVPDPFIDDLAMTVETENGLNVITGCAHSGVINVLLAVENGLNRKVDLLIGGTHLGPAPKPQQDKALAELETREGLKVAAGHCTGEDIQKKMANMLGDRFLGLSGGMVLSL
jgi:7,8-dihydropterin-6-yl-methyl-4-(beta-D-ribofuranosyl)aminobenzene 5'-phosphate synthase